MTVTMTVTEQEPNALVRLTQREGSESTPPSQMGTGDPDRDSVRWRLLSGSTGDADWRWRPVAQLRLCGL